VKLFLHQLHTEQLLYWRSRESAVFTFIFPLLLFVLLGSVYSGRIYGVDALIAHGRFLQEKFGAHLLMSQVTEAIEGRARALLSGLTEDEPADAPAPKPSKAASKPARKSTKAARAT